MLQLRSLLLHLQIWAQTGKAVSIVRAMDQNSDLSGRVYATFLLHPTLRVPAHTFIDETTLLVARIVRIMAKTNRKHIYKSIIEMDR